MKQYPILNRNRLHVKPLEARDSGMDTSAFVEPDSEPSDFTVFDLTLKEKPDELNEHWNMLHEIVDAVKNAKANQRGFIITYGAHLIKI